MPILKDLALDENGELAVGYNGDLLVVRNSQVVLQELRWRLKTQKGDWALEPSCGADLELLIGEPNTPETGEQMRFQMEEALTHDGFIVGELRELLVTPINRDTLQGTVILDTDTNQAEQITVTLDLREGVF